MVQVSRKTLLFASIALLFILVVFLSLGLGLFLISPADREGKEEVFIVRDGSSLREVAQDLEKRGLVKSKTLFVLWSRMMGHSKGIKSGEYILSASMPPVKILEKLRRGLILTHIITIPEGYTREEIADLIDAKELVDRNLFLSLTEEEAVLQNTVSPGRTWKGIFFPTPISSVGVFLLLLSLTRW